MDNSLFKTYLRKLYKQINKSSNLLWSHRNHITGKRTKKFDEEEKFFNIKTTQIGYGEISLSSMTQLYNLFSNIDEIIEDMKINKKKLKYDSYNINKDSYFLDIGSGFGKPIYHCAFQIGCKSQGIEVVPARVEFCKDFYYEFLSDKDFFNLNCDNQQKELFDDEFNNCDNIHNGNNCNNENYFNFFNNNICFNCIGNKKILNKKIVLDFSFNNNKLIKFRFDWFNEYILKIKKLQNLNYIYSIDNIIDYNILFNNKEKDFNECISILCPDELNIKFGKQFLDITRITIISNQKLTNNFSKILIHNLYSNLLENNTSYIPIYEVINHCSDLENKYILDLMLFINSITKITKKRIIEEKKEEKSEKNEKESFLHHILNKFSCVNFNPNFYNLCSFLCKDATKYDSYKFFDENLFDKNNIDKIPNSEHFTHIYSYNKLMGDACRKKISKILNKTNWKVLAWYSNEHQTKKSGLTHFVKIGNFQMNSTGNEKFSCYVYIKTK